MRRSTMIHRFQSLRVLRSGLLSMSLVLLLVAEVSAARLVVYFSPPGGPTAAIVRELQAATTQILVQAYTFTSAPIAQALVDAKKRGVAILVVLDGSNAT